MKSKIEFFLSIIPVTFLWILYRINSDHKPVPYFEMVKELWEGGFSE